MSVLHHCGQFSLMDEGHICQYTRPDTHVSSQCSYTHSHTYKILCSPSCCDDRVACDLPSMHCSIVDVMSLMGPTLIICLFIPSASVLLHVCSQYLQYMQVLVVCVYICMRAYFSDGVHYIILQFILWCVCVRTCALYK